MLRVQIIKKCMIFFLFLFLCFNIEALNRSSSLLETGINDYKKAQYSFAVNNLKKFIQLSEDNTEKPKAYFFLSLSYYFLDNYRMSLHHFNELSTRFRVSSYTAESYFWKGLIYQNLDQWQDAEMAFLKYTELIPSSDIIQKAYLAAANSQLALGKYKEAESNLKIIIDKYEKSDKYEEASVLYAYILINTNKKDKAKDFLDRWVGKLGQDGKDYLLKDRFWLYSAELYYMDKEYKKAKVLLKKIDSYAKKSPSSDIALLRLSQVARELGNLKESREYLIRLAEEHSLSKYNIDASIALGLAEYDKEEFSNAIVMFEQTLKLIDKNIFSSEKEKPKADRLNELRGITLLYLANAYKKQGNKTLALENYDLIVKEKLTQKTKALFSQLEIYFENNMTDELNSIVQKYDVELLKDQEISDEYLIYRSKIEYLNGDYNKAIQTLEGLTNIDDHYELITSMKVNILIKQNKINDAIKILESIFQEIPLSKKASTAVELMSLYFEMNNQKKVIEYFEIAEVYSKYSEKNKDKLFIRSYYFAGLSHMQLKNNKKGIWVLNELLNKYDNKKLEDDLKAIIDITNYYLGWLYYKESQFSNSSFYFKKAGTVLTDKKIKKDSFFMEAWSYFSDKNYKNAANRFEKIYRDFYPDEIGINAYFQLGKTFKNLNERSKALEVFHELYNSKRDSKYKEESLYEIILFSLNDNKIDEANDLINEFSRKFGKSEYYKDILVLQAEKLILTERFSEALSIYGFVIKNYKKAADLESIYYWGGYSAEKTKDRTTAKEYLNIVVKEYERSSFYKDALKILSSVYQQEKNAEKEKSMLKLLLDIEKDAGKKNKYRKRLNILEMIKKGIDEKEAALLMKVENGDNEAKLELANYYYEKGKIDKCKKLFKEISEKDTKIIGSKANLGLGDIEFDKKNYKEAIAIYLKTIKSYKTSNDIKAEALYKTAFSYFRIDQFEASRKVLQKLYSSFPDSDWSTKGKDLERRIQQ